jgi:eukaryotic-like serine/threonine-protein kinase
VTVAYQHVQEPPRPLREWEPSVSPGAEAIAMRALAKNPANRYQSAAEMRDDLLNARVGNPVAAPAVLTADDTALLQPAPTTRAVRTHEQERRRRGTVYGLLAVLSILALIGAVWVLAGTLGGDDGPRVAVPDVVGQPVEAARDILTQRGFVIGEETFEFSAELEEGRVIRQRPGADSMADEGATVDLVISQGEQVAVVPDIVGLTEDEAFGRLREEGLAPGQRSREFSSDVPEGRIISSSPAAGEEVPVRSRVAYVVSAG